MEKNIRFISATGMLMLVLMACVLGQEGTASHRELKIGDKVPRHRITNSLGLSEKYLTDFAGKLTILDFWNTGCGACIESFPKVAKLKEKYKAEVNIVLVNNRQDYAGLQRFFERRKAAGMDSVQLPQIYGDSVLTKVLLPTSYVPHIVWIDAAGVVKLITAGDALNEANIDALLRGELPDVDPKPAIWQPLEWDATKPMYVKGNGGDGHQLFWRSYLGSYDPDLGGNVAAFSNPDEGYSVVCTNCSVVWMYRMAYSNFIDADGILRPVPEFLCEFDIRDQRKYFAVTDSGYDNEHHYSYQLTATRGSLRQLQTYMQQDMDRYFGLTAYWTKMKRECLVLTSINPDKFAYKGGKRRMRITQYDVKVNKVTIADIFHYLTVATSYGTSRWPLIDETNYEGLIGDIEFSTDVNDPVKLAKALEPYGLKLSFEEREVMMFVVSDRDVRGEVGGGQW